MVETEERGGEEGRGKRAESMDGGGSRPGWQQAESEEEEKRGEEGGQIVTVPVTAKGGGQPLEAVTVIV